MKKVVHIIYRDKFTSGYINFMNLEMKGYQHRFITTGDRDTLQVVDKTLMVYIDNYRNLVKNIEVQRLLKDCDLIITSGIFGISKYLLKLPNEILNKMSLQFWGGDFYEFRDLQFKLSKKVIKKIISRWRLKQLIKKVDSLLFLVPKDYNEYLSILKIPKKHYVVPMPTEPVDENDYVQFTDIECNNRILVGNSATMENQHKEAFDLVKDIDESAEVVCPLSYGDKEYAQEVISYGTKLFGERFIPLTQFYDKKEYIKILSTCSIGVFNNNRQQALGNIYIMLELGKKVYIRKDTPMWDYFESLDIKVYDIASLGYKDDEIEGYSFEELRVINSNISKKVKENSLIRWKEFYETMLKYECT